MKATVLLLFILAAIVCVSEARNEIDGQEVVQASEILAKIERGELVNYTQKTIEGDINLSDLKLPKIRINRTMDEIEYHGLSETQTIVGSMLFFEDCLIKGDIDFSNVCFLEPVTFWNSSIIGDADFSGSQFDLFGIILSKFNQSVDFSYSQFKEDAYFPYSEFNQSVDYKRSQFNKSVFFKESKFDKQIDFSMSRFSQSIDFSFFYFNASVDFGGSHFAQSADFSYTQFNQSVDFRADFNQSADFDNVQFNGDADFSGSQFNQSATFDDAQFNQDVDFSSTQFTGDVDFSSTQFNKRAKFYFSNFSGDVDFHGSIFNEYADFWESRFQKSANFMNSEFGQSADFGGSVFRDDVNFRESQFSEDAYFGFTKFKKNVDFEDAKISGELSFEGSRISRLNLKDTEINNIRLRSWKSIGHMEYDEMAYQLLLSSFKNRNLPDDANECYYDYREGRRATTLNLLYRPVDYALMLFYGYGVKPERPVIWAFVLIGIFAAFFWWRQGIIPVREGEPESEANRFTLTEAIAFSGMTFLSGGKLVFDPPEYRIAPGKRWRDVQICKALFVWERLMGMILIVMFAIAVSKTIILGS